MLTLSRTHDCQFHRRAIAVALLCAIAGCGDSQASPKSSPTNSAVARPLRVTLIDAFMEITIGDSARRITAIVERTTGVVDTVSPTQLTPQDTTVVRVVDGAVVAVNVGQTAIRLDVEGQPARAVVTVRERVFADSVWLGPGEVRAWELQPSWYHITVDATPFPGEPQTLELGADLICVPESRNPKTIVCRVRQNTRVILRHTGVSARREKALAVVTIYRTAR